MQPEERAAPSPLPAVRRPEADRLPPTQSRSAAPAHSHGIDWFGPKETAGSAGRAPECLCPPAAAATAAAPCASHTTRAAATPHGRVQTRQSLRGLQGHLQHLQSLYDDVQAQVRALGTGGLPSCCLKLSGCLRPLGSRVLAASGPASLDILT